MPSNLTHTYHQFMPPGPNDARGPCPGLNAMANHNYLPRSGIATVNQFITGTHDAFGMGTVIVPRRYIELLERRTNRKKGSGYHSRCLWRCL